MEFTNEQIIEILEYCSDSDKPCLNCSIYKVDNNSKPKCASVLTAAVGLIKKLQEENEELKKIVDRQTSTLMKRYFKLKRQDEEIQRLKKALPEAPKPIMVQEQIFTRRVKKKKGWKQ